MAEMAQPVQIDFEPDFEAKMWAAFGMGDDSNNAVQSDTAEMAHQEPGDFSADLNADMDGESLFVDEPQHPSSPKLGDAARQDSVQPAASQAQGSMSEEGSQPTGLALPRLALPKLAAPKPAPVVVAEQPQVVEPVVTGPLGKKRAAPRKKGKGKARWMAYSGAQVPEQSAGQATVRPATAPYELAVPRDEDLIASPEQLEKLYDSLLGTLDGDIEQQVAPAPAPAQPAENDLFMPDADFGYPNGAEVLTALGQEHIPGDMGQYGAEIDLAGAPDFAIDLTGPEPFLPTQQQPPVAPMTHQSAEIAQAIPAPPPPPQVPIVPIPDDVDRDFAAGKWGRWNPKGMNQKQYVILERQPYEENNPRDIYDYLQAVVAAIMREWPGRWYRWEQEGGQPGKWKHLVPTDPALFWFDCAWKRLCESYEAQWVEKERFLPVELQQRLLQCHEWVARKSLLNNSFAEETVETVMAALVKFSQMRGGALQQGLSQQQAIVLE